MARCIPGVGKVTETRLKQTGMHLNCRRPKVLELAALEAQFGRYGTCFYDLVRGIDHNKVIPYRPTKLRIRNAPTPYKLTASASFPGSIQAYSTASMG
jgi:nucleotidyltransferase/DNA polymerase involved in DNA repair